VTVGRNSNNKWYASVLIKQSQLVPDHVHRLEACGIDVGVAKPITLVDEYGHFKHLGVKFSNELAKKEAKRKRYQKAYARKLKGSNNQAKAKLKLGTAFYKEKQFRKDYLEKTSTIIAKLFHTVIVEDLKLANMTRSAKGTIESPGTNVSAKSGLNREMLRLGLGYFLMRLHQKCTKFGSLFIRVDPKCTSQICSTCNHKDRLSRESQSRFKCTSCGILINADVNAAINILNRGLLLV
jgi:putative transposase